MDAFACGDGRGGIKCFLGLGGGWRGANCSSVSLQVRLWIPLTGLNDVAIHSYSNYSIETLFTGILFTSVTYRRISVIAFKDDRFQHEVMAFRL